MFQKFYSENITTRFIKHLLSVSPIPHLNYVENGDIVIKDCYYIYKNYVIKCVETGELAVDAQSTLYPGDTIYPSVVLFPGSGKIPAKFKVVRYVSTNDSPRTTYTYKSKRSYYDPETHMYLGEYLRWLRGSYGLDLMPFYNCFNQEYETTVQLRRDSATVILYPSSELYPQTYLYPGKIKSKTTTYTTDVSESDYKVLSVPIKFNKTYTIALESNSPVILRGVIMSRGQLIKSGKNHLADESALVSSYRVYQTTRFNKPFLYSIGTDSKLLYNNEKNLRLLIQIPSSEKTSIVVLEGDYTQLNVLHTTVDLDEKKGSQIYNNLINLSLLQGNTLESYAFSDRLVEYLLKNVICSLDDLTNNVARVQVALKQVDEDYDKIFGSRCTYGIWDDYIKNATERFILEQSKKYYLIDMDGNINKDVEALFVTCTKGEYDG